MTKKSDRRGDEEYESRTQILHESSYRIELLGR